MDATIKAFDKDTFPVNPPLPKDFDITPHDERPEWQQTLWDRPFIQIVEFSGNPKLKEQWFKKWPTGKRFDVRCLDGGAWDRTTLWGMFDSIEKALDCCKSGPSYISRRELVESAF